MPRNLVICSDGTGNTFDQRVSNVSSLVQAMDLARPDDQMAFYDQGIGTTSSLVERVKAFKSIGGRSRAALEILAPPKVSVARPFAKLAGLAVGYGLYANLREMYQALARFHNPANDLIFLFGFSRGAFTVRALAGLIYRCGLPARRFAEDDTAFASCFAQAREVLFTGCHSDIGGGDEEAQTARITFRWMMGEATHLGLLLGPTCDRWIFEPDDTRTRPVVHESYGAGWWVSDLIPRWELDNSTRPPGYPFKWPGRGRRCAENFRRRGNLHFHSTVGITPAPGIAVVETLPSLTRDNAASVQAQWMRAPDACPTPSASSR